MNKFFFTKIVPKLFPLGTRRRMPVERLFYNLMGIKESIKRTIKKKGLINAKLEEHFLPFYFPLTENPTISIIIPVYNKFVYTYTCLKSIFKNTDNIKYEVIIVDNASTDSTLNLPSLAKNIHIIQNKENLGFVEACNIGAGRAQGQYLLFLNNDTKVTNGWLNAMFETLENNDQIGLVGAKLIYANGSLQEAGGIVWNDEKNIAWNYGRYKNPDNYEYNYLKEVDYCSGACILTRKELFTKIGGFDSQYAPAYCEDSDLAFSIRKLGYRVVYQPKAEIIHFEGITAGTDVLQGKKKFQIINQEKFYQKWKGILNKEHFRNGDSLFLARDRTRFKKILLYIDYAVPAHDKDAGSLTAYMYLKLFTEMGFKVIFVPDNYFKVEPYTSGLQQMGIEVLYGPMSFKKWVRQNGSYIDFVWISRPYIAQKYIKMIKKFTDAKVLYYTVDLHYLREMRQYELEGKPHLLKSANRSKKIESQVFDQVDVVLTPSDEEVNIIKNDLPSTNVKKILGFFYEKNTEVENDIPSFDKRSDILFLGGFDHLPNVDAVEYFSKEVLPIIKKSLPQLKFYIVGNNPPEAVKNLASESIIVTGYVKDLNQYFQNSRICVAPLRYGAGVKGKIVTSMLHGVPVVTTTIGIEGLGLVDRQHCMVADDPKEFASRVLDLYSNEKMWEQLSQNAAELIENNFSKDAAKEIMFNILGSV